MEYPSIVGGFSLRQFDLAPSIVFAALHGLLIPIYIYRLFSKRSSTSLFSGASGFVVERVILFSLRAVVAPQQPSDQSLGLMEYMQLTLAIGLLAIILDFASLLRCVLVNSTYPHDKSELESQSNTLELVTDAKLSWKGTSNSETSIYMEKNPTTDRTDSLAGQRPDQPRHRFWFRRMNDLMVAGYVAGLATGIVGNTLLIHQRDNPKKTHVNQILRYTSSTLAVILALTVCGVATWAERKLPRVNKRAASYLVFLSLLLVIPGVYRLAVMHTKTTTPAYESSGPGSYNSAGAKAAFYLFHILPEWIVCCVMAALNVRQTFGTGSHGDFRWRDETPAEKEKREQKEAKKREKKLLRAAGKTRRWYCFSV